MVSLTMSEAVIPASSRTLVRFPRAVFTWSAISPPVGAPSSPTEVCPEQRTNAWAPSSLTACEKPNAFDHSHGLTSVRFMDSSFDGSIRWRLLRLYFDQLEPRARSGLDRHGSLPAPEVAGDERDELAVGFAVHRR